MSYLRQAILLSALLAWCVPIHAAIARDGTCSAAAASCTFSGTAAGSIKIVMSIHYGATTIPTLPAGWTSITTGSFNSATAAGWRIGCNDSSSGSDTGSGTWTNGTQIVGVSLSGTAVTSTGTCVTDTIGGTSTAQNNNATISYNTITMVKSDGTSWVMATCGESTQTTCGTAPTGMTNVANIPSTQDTGLHDTEAGKTSWSTTTVSTTSTQWMTWVGEILASTGGGASPVGVSKLRKLDILDP